MRWVTFTMARHTFACAARRCLLDGIPGLRLPGSAVSPRFSPLRTSLRPGGDAVTSAPEGRALHPHGTLSYKALRFAVYPRTASFSQNTFGLHYGVWGVDSTSWQAYNVSMVIVPCGREEWGMGRIDTWLLSNGQTTLLRPVIRQARTINLCCWISSRRPEAAVNA